MIDNIEVRRRVGEAALRIAAARREQREANRDRLDKARARWRRLSDEAEAARKEYERLAERPEALADDVAIIEEAKEQFPGLLFFEHDNLDPMTCLATGLALMEGDETYGAPEYGAVLKSAVRLGVAPVSGWDERE